MLSKFSIAAVAAIALGTAALAPTSASAWWHGGGGWHGGGWGWHGGGWHRGWGWRGGWWGAPRYYGVYGYPAYNGCGIRWAC